MHSCNRTHLIKPILVWLSGQHSVTYGREIYGSDRVLFAFAHDLCTSWHRHKNDVLCESSSHGCGFYYVSTSSGPVLLNMKILPHFPPDTFIVLARLVPLTIQRKNQNCWSLHSISKQLLLPEKNTLIHLIYYKTNQMKSLGILQLRHVIKSLLILL